MSFGATFIPGGQDDYYMPEVIAPAPQRVMPEVPQNMQEDIQRLETEARNTDPNGRPAAETDEKSFKAFQTHASQSSTMDVPSFSPFPKVKGENIPPSDEEKEQILWQARNLVLHSNNVSMQVTWARDVLIWVEIAQDALTREWKRDGKDKDRPATPKTEHELRNDAVNIIEYLAQQDHPEATFMKGKWHEFGKFGFRENKREAYALYKKAADMGYGRAEYRMGMLYENSNDIPNAIKHYTKGADTGDSASSYRLGMMHLMGQHGFQRDFLQALQLIQHAADTADEDAPQGAYVYGMLIARELPDITVPEHILPYDLPVARQYIEKAAYLSFAKAQLKMGQAYELSQLGCDFNPAYSLHYYGLAARQGQPEASLGVSRWFLFGYEDLFPKNEQLAFKYAMEAALAGLATGEFAMGYYHEIGIHVAKDVREARRCQSRTLTKADHETTTLTRIKSQHGSMRGKRPDRFNKPAGMMPTVTETDPNGAVPAVQFPDPTPRPPAFTVNLDGTNAPPTARPRSAAPYPVDDQAQPPPLNVRPRSAAPYPENDVRPGPGPGPGGPGGPYLNPGQRLGPGPVSDRPGSAFGIRPLSSGGLPAGPAGGDGRGRPVSSQPGMPGGGGWDPQAGYRRPSPGPGPQGQWQSPPPQGPGPRYGPGPGGPGGPGGPMPPDGRNKLQKQNPNLPPQPQSPPFPSPGTPQPGPGYGRGGPPGSGGYPPNPYGPGPGLPSSPNMNVRPSQQQAQPRPGPGGPGGPPGQQGRPVSQVPSPQQRPSPGPAVANRPPTAVGGAGGQGGGGRPAQQQNLAHPDGKTMGQGPATFEEMGIPQGKSENDCVVM
ncbi:hypothetical protein VTJ49DRAFT_4941 [Mycothermus thermophilus]|uniref:Chitin synthase regulatory factor 4 n=1 Tax=Humicola insolens TaxID=85995 RepID=A0ABR3VQA6_HUMIN